MPRASVTMTVAANAGARNQRRKPSRRSRSQSNMTVGRGARDSGCLDLSAADEFPESRFVEQRDPMALLAEALDLHQLQSAGAAGCLQRIGTSAHHDGG